MMNGKKPPVKVEYDPDRIGIQALLVALFLAVMPLSRITFFAGFSILKLITIPVALYCLAALFIGNVAIDLNSVHLTYSLFMLYSIGNALLNFTDETWISLRGYLELFIIAILFSLRLYSPKEKRVLENAVLFSGVFVVFFSLFSTDVMAEGRRTMSFLGAYYDPNELCGMIILPLVLCLERIQKSEKKFGYVCFALLMLYVTVATGSRGGVIAVAVSAFAFAMFAVHGVKGRAVTFVAIIALVVTFVFVVYPLLPQEMQDRFSVERVVEDKGSGRFDLWAAVFDSASEKEEYMIWGQGINSTANALTERGFSNTVAHNEIIQLFHDSGIVGLLLFLLMIACAFLRNIRKRSSVAIALVGMMALSMSLSYDPAVKFFWNTVMLCAFSYGKNEEDINEQKS